ncbi:helix-turn-helix domain-containing protein [Leifsonia sp. ZF2019]|uniref:helix-turn-helix domain-containing protein n=1 Tax=Leifsonia sp. ZF2019 TaxID=2781978 RepID=UPI001CBE0B52|nr:helix-turn-helix domain-containing protein [Leifsonia sp. ZF2019]UAJ79892.1 helix-turn-helix domain-containing protein [Leifsonia sp. ZF2019]
MSRHEVSHLRRTLVSAPRLRLLERLQAESPQTAPRLAASVGLHHNTVREHLDRLVDDGLVVRTTEHRTVRGRPQVLYSAARGLDGASASARAQTGRAIELGRAYRRSFPQGPREAAGPGEVGPAAESAADAQLDVLEDYLDRCGFDPQVDRDALEIRLSCPFEGMRSELSESLCTVDRRVVCSVLARVEGPLAVTGITPTGEAGACVLTMERG